MARLNEEELASLAAQIREKISGTQYECSSLALLSGGSTNFVYRGALVSPLSSGAKTVIVKHTPEFLACSRDFRIDVSRCFAEGSMLNALEGLPFKTPRLLFFDRDGKTQVHEDFPSALLLQPFLISRTADRALATSIGRDLGSSLRAFHDWTPEAAQSELRAEIWQNEPMRQLKLLTSYKSFIGVLEKFPGVVEGHVEALKEVQAMATEEFARQPSDGADPLWGLIHGDFCEGNALLMHPPSPNKPNDLAIIDWELSQHGHRAYDLGQMVGDLCEKRFLDEAESAVWAIEGFARGYGELSEELAFRTAIHAGAHFIHWYIRRPPGKDLLATPERITNAMKLGRDFIVKGWARDREWFKGTALAPLFGFQGAT